VHDLGAEERGAQHRRVRHLPAQAAAHAGVVTCATGSTLSGSLEFLTVSEGQPESRMQEWSPVHTSSSSAKRVRTTRLPALSLAATADAAAAGARAGIRVAMITLSPE